MIAKAKPNQPSSWKTLGRNDLRAADDRRPAPDLVHGGETHEEAIAILVERLGFRADTDMVEFASPCGTITAHRNNLPHIVEKRQDARERYVQFAIDTMTNPLEVWRIEYDDETFRQAYIGAFVGKTQMLVIVSQEGGQLLWNFMHGEAKAINKHRHGELVFSRPTPENTKGELN